MASNAITSTMVIPPAMVGLRWADLRTARISEPTLPEAVWATSSAALSDCDAIST